MKNILMLAVFALLTACSFKFDTETAGKIMSQVYEARYTGNTKKELALYSSRLPEDGLSKIERLISVVKERDGKLLDVKNIKSKISNKNGSNYLILSYQTKYEKNSYVETYTFDSEMETPELIGVFFQ